jgi:hypothetical protein
MLKLEIKTEEEIINLLKNIVSGETDYLDSIDELVVDKNLTTFQLTLCGEHYNDAQIPSKIMECLIDFQNKIYNAYSIINYEGDRRNLTILDKEKLELYFEINKGSLNIETCVDFAKTFLKNMDSRDKKHTAIALILTVAITYFGKTFTDSYFKSKEDGQKTEIHLETIKALKEVNPAYQKIIDDATKNKDKCITAAQDCDKIVFQGNDYSNNDIQNIIARREIVEDKFTPRKLISTFRIFRIENSVRSLGLNDLRINLINTGKINDNKINGVKISEDVYNDERKINLILDAVRKKTELKLEVLIQEEKESKTIKDPILLDIILQN